MGWCQVRLLWKALLDHLFGRHFVSLDGILQLFHFHSTAVRRFAETEKTGAVASCANGHLAPRTTIATPVVAATTKCPAAIIAALVANEHWRL